MNIRRPFYNKVIPHLGVLLTSYCNLNCRDCADFIPRRPQRNMDKADFYKYMGKILKVVNHVGEILLIGGEVFLYKDLSEILEWCINHDQIHQVALTTNGTIIPDDEIMQKLCADKVLLRISGYPETVAPMRKELVDKATKLNIRIHDLENMTWSDTGSRECRHRTREELEEVFNSCTMADCIGLMPEGYITFCSRQGTALETDFYPTPLKNEYINLNECSDEELYKKIVDFYELTYISTCDYCDGIRFGIRNAVAPTAVQNMPKRALLGFISAMDRGENETDAEYTIRTIKLIKENLEFLVGFKNLPMALDVVKNINVEDPSYILKLRGLMRALADEVVETFDLEVSFRSEEFREIVKEKDIYSNRNKIKIALLNFDELPDGDADIYLKQSDLESEAFSGWGIDEYTYGRLYIECSQETKRKVKGVISGLSYVQYGIIPDKFSDEIVNLAIGGLDIRYSLEFARRLLEDHDEVKWIAIPISYYQGFYDLDSSQRTFHKLIKEKIVYPCLGIKRSFDIQSPFKRVIDLGKIRMEIENRIKSVIDGKGYFNEIHPYNMYGGLTYDFRQLNEKERYAAAMKTVNGNQSVFEPQNAIEINILMREFVEDMNEKKINVLFFTPPATKYVYEQADPKIKELFYESVLNKIDEYENCKYIDLYDSDKFGENDYVDFEHLNRIGAEKMSEIINSIVISGY